MPKPHWELLHDWFLNDIKFELSQFNILKLMLRKHPDDTTGEIIRTLIAGGKSNLNHLIMTYENIYGDRPPIRKLKEEVERE